MVEFAYNSNTDKSIQCTPFESVHGRNPTCVIDLAPLPLPIKIHPKAGGVIATVMQ